MIFPLEEFNNLESAKLVSATSRKEIIGWYSCGFSNEVFSVVSITTFVPILLEQLVRYSGVLSSDKSTPCTTDGSLFNTFAYQNDKSSNLCVIYIHGIGWIDSYSFSLYVYSIASFLQSIVIISISGLADYGKNRKTLLLIFSIIGSLSTFFFIFIDKQYLYASLLFILGNICYGATTVLLNAFLPGLCKNHPSFLRKHDILKFLHHSLLNENIHENEFYLKDDENVSLLNFTKIYDSQLSALMSDLSSRLSLYGIAIGYSGAIIFQIISIIIISIIGTGIKSSQIIISISGLWWLFFSIPIALWLKSRHMSSLSDEISGSSIIGYILYSWKSFLRTFLDAQKYNDIMIFIASLFFMSDAYSSIISTTILFVKSTLHISSIGLIMVSLLSTLFGIIGAFSWPYISRRLKFSPSKTLIFILFLSIFIPIYGIFGFLPIPIGLKSPIEVYIMAAFFGFLYGGLQGYARSFFGELCPENHETRFYALYSITEKCSSFFGPGIIGYIVDCTHNMRYAFFFLLTVMIISILILLKISNK